jgi:enolase
MSQIIEIKARQILDSKGNPTIETEVYTNRGAAAKASVPSSFLVPDFSAKELRDNDNGKYHGLGVLRAVSNINKLINDELKGSFVFNQSAIDAALIQLDGSNDKSSLGVNAVLSVSLAVAKVAAISTGQSLYRYIGGINGNTLPIPMINMIENDYDDSDDISIKEFMIMPVGFDTFTEAVRASVEIDRSLNNMLKTSGMNNGIGLTGGYITKFKTNKQIFETIIDAVEKSKYKIGESFTIAIDANTDESYDESKKKYVFNKKELNSTELEKKLIELCQQYPIVSISDPFHFNDLSSWKQFSENSGEKIQVAGNRFFCGNPDRLINAIEENIAHGIYINPIQIGTVTEILNIVNLAKSAMYNTVFSISNYDTDDLSLTDLCVALNTGIAKLGAFSAADANIRYNRLMRVEEELGSSAKYGNN